MMKFHSLSIHNLFSMEHLELPIGDYGITLIAGRGEGAFPSNGAGKSSIFEALVWALFGRTIRDLPYDDKVIRDDADQGEALVKLTIESKAYNIQRSKSRGEPARLSVLDDSGEEVFLTGTVVEKTKALEQLIRCDFDTFCNTAYFPQEKFTFFTQASDGDRKKVFDQILGTGYFQGLEKRARELKAEVQHELQKHTDEIEDIIKVKLEAQEEEVRRLQFELDESANRTEADRKTLKDELDQLRLTQTSAINTKKELEKRRESMRDQIKEVKKIDKLLGQLHEEVSGRAAEYKLRVSKLERAEKDYAEAANDSASHLQLLEKGRCPYCKQKFVDTESLSEMGQSLHDKLEATEESVTTYTKLEEEAEARYDQAKRKYDEVRPKNTLENLSERLKKVEEDLEDTNVQLATISGDMSGRQRALARLDQLVVEQVDRLEAQLVMTKDTLVRTQQRLVAKQEEVDAVEKHIARLDFWIDGFGPRGMRSLIFENMLPFINERANLYSSQLTDGAIRIEITATTQLKSGDLREKIAVSAVNDQGASVYGGNSGGERKRIDLAILLALQDLIASRSGAAVQLAVYDEILDMLDEGGIQRVVDLFHEMAKTKPIFVITHSEWLTSYFEDRLTVVKKDGISSLES